MVRRFSYYFNLSNDFFQYSQTEKVYLDISFFLITRFNNKIVTQTKVILMNNIV